MNGVYSVLPMVGCTLSNNCRSTSSPVHRWRHFHTPYRNSTSSRYFRLEALLKNAPPDAVIPFHAVSRIITDAKCVHALASNPAVLNEDGECRACDCIQRHLTRHCHRLSFRPAVRRGSQEQEDEISMKSATN